MRRGKKRLKILFFILCCTNDTTPGFPRKKRPTLRCVITNTNEWLKERNHKMWGYAQTHLLGWFHRKSQVPDHLLR